MNKNIRIYTVTIIFILCGSFSAKSQTSKFLRDTVYILSCKGNLENGRPVAGYLLIKSLDYLRDLKCYSNQDSLICSIMQKASFFNEPYLTLGRDRKLYSFKSKDDEDSFYKNYYKMLKELSIGYSSFFKCKFNDGRKLDVSIVKVDADFWIIGHGQAKTSENFSFKTCDYEPKEIYDLKTLYKIYK